MSAPSAARRRACAIAAAGSRNRPPSENESAVMLTIPTRRGPTRRGPTSGGPGIVSVPPAAFQNCADRLGLGEYVELFDLDPDMADARIGETRVRDARGKPFAQIDM